MMAKQENRSKVVLRSVADKSIDDVVQECMELCEWQNWVGRNATVVLKPNLCTIVPEQMEKSNSDVRLTEAVCKVLLQKTDRIYIGEADHLRQQQVRLLNTVVTQTWREGWVYELLILRTHPG